MVVLSSPPWAETPALALPLLEEASESGWDCLVVGCGGAACFAALELARSGARVALLADARQQERVLRLPGVALPCLADHYWSLTNGIGREQSAIWWRMAAEGSGRIRQTLIDAGLEDEYNVSGSVLQLAVNTAEANEMIQGLRPMREDGIDVRMMGAAASSNYAPVGEPEGALFFPNACVFDPARWQTALLQSLLAAGVRCFATNIQWQLRTEPVSLQHENQVIGAESLVLGNGLEALKMLGVQKRWLIPMRGQTLLSSPIRQGLRSSVVALTANRSHEVYRDWDGAFVVAGMHPGANTEELTEELVVDPAFCDRLEQNAGQRLTELSTAAAVRRWATVYEYSMDGLPLVGTVAGQGPLWIAAGFATSEWSLGAGAGLEIARALQGSVSVLRDLPSASPRRFS